jgi:DNA-binding CsgD family transcriptional regulator
MAPSSRSTPAAELIGREAETARLDSLLDRLPEGGGAIVIRGEAGIGKSAMLALVGERASALGFAKLATVGVESEAELAFAGLHQLLLPIIGSIELLPASQRQPLNAVFGTIESAEPDPFRVAMAAFRLVIEAAESSPLVLLVDDAHWLDRSSLGVLTFIARRLEGVPVALVATVRTGYAAPFDEARLPILELGRLSAEAAAAVLDRAAPQLHPVSRARVLAEAAGNPLALVELPRTAPYSPASRERIAPAPATLNARLEQAFAARLRDLPEDTSLVVLAAALDSRASLAELTRAATALHKSPVSIDALEPAVALGLIDVGEGEVQFRHPLIRSAVRQAASPTHLLAMYAVLATVVSDPERRLWHRAMAAAEPDEEVASALEEHARTARRRGAVAAAGAALERAAALTPDPRKRSERLVSAAEVAYDLGLVDVVRRLVDQAEPIDMAPQAEARRAWLNEMTSGNVWFDSHATRTFVTIAQRLAEAGDDEGALRSLVPIAHRCWWTHTQPRTRQFVADAAGKIGVSEHDPRLLAVLALADPEGTGAAVLRRIAAVRSSELADPLAAMHVGIAAEVAGDFLLGSRLLTAGVSGLRAQIRLVPLTQALVHFAWAATHTGEWPAAVAAGEEAASLAQDTRQPQYGVTGELFAALARALLGSPPDLEASLAESERTVLAIRSTPLLATAHLARGAAALGGARYDDAFRHLWPVFDEDDAVFHRFMRWSAVLDVVEAAVHSGHVDRIAPVIAEIEDIAARSNIPYLGIQLKCARPLLAYDDAGELFTAALAGSVQQYPFLQARTLFSFGSWLRRRRRSADARGPLRRSVELFDVLGASAWSTRARQELRATGETIGPRTPEARDRLTAQELQIAQLAADGLSNREIGERLFLSHRTVGSHLYRIYPKLRIAARGQLRESLEIGAGD